jgi:O-antigen/teichoic acid export membrane protein
MQSDLFPIRNILQVIKSRLAAAVLWSLSTAVCLQGSTLLINFVLARRLSPEQFGVYIIVQSTLVTASTVASLGLGLFTSKYVAELKLTDKKKTGEILAIARRASIFSSVFITALFLLLAGQIAVHVLRDPLVQTHLLVGAFFVFFNCFAFHQSGALSGLESYKSQAVTAGASSLIMVPVCIALSSHWQAIGAVVGISLGACIRSLLFELTLRKSITKEGFCQKYNGLSRHARSVLGFLTPAALSGLITPLAMWASNVVSFQQAHGPTEMGLYGVAFNLKTIVSFFVNVFNGVSVTILNSKRSSCRNSDFLLYYRRNIVLLGSAAMIIAGSLALCGVPLLRAFGPSFASAYSILLLLLLSAVLEAISTGLYQIVQVEEKLWPSLFFISLPREATLFILALTLCPRYGALGLALASIGAQGCGMIGTAAVAALTMKGRYAGGVYV